VRPSTLFIVLGLGTFVTIGCGGDVITDPCADAHCDDGNPCTANLCDPATGECSHPPFDCDDDDPCTTEWCDPVAGRCIITPLDCDDGNACTVSACNPTTGACEHSPVDCGDGIACTTNFCDPVEGCQTVAEHSMCATADECWAGACDTEVGCVQSPLDDTDCGEGEGLCGGGECHLCGQGTRRVYVFDLLQIGVETPPDSGQVPGLDLDGTSEPICGHEDFAWDGQEGVDNQLSQMVDFIEEAVGIDPNDAMREAVGSGEVLVLLEVEGGEEGLFNNPCVTVSLRLGAVPVGADGCDSDGDGVIDYLDADPLDPAVTRFASGLVIDVDAASLEVDGVTPIALGRGRIEEGVLTARLPEWDVRFEYAGFPLRVPINEVRLRLELDASEVIEDGIVAGSVSVAEVTPIISDLVADYLGPDNEFLVRIVLDGFADLEPNDRGSCQAISAGLIFDAVTAELGVVRHSPASPQCL
jgi:hypothetical protein